MNDFTEPPEEIDSNFPPASPYQLLVPLSNLKEATLLLPLADILAADKNGQIIILSVTIVPEGDSLSEATGEATRLRQAISNLVTDMVTVPTQTRSLVMQKKELWDGVWNSVSQEEIDLLLVAWNSENFQETTFEDLDNPSLSSPPCDLVVLKVNEQLLTSLDWNQLKRILLAVRGGVNAALALRVGNAIAQTLEGFMTLLHVTSKERREDEETFLDEFTPALYGLERITRSITLKGDIAAGIVSESGLNDVVIMGAPSRQVRKDHWSGPILDTVFSETNAVLIVARKGDQESFQTIEFDEPEIKSSDRPVNLVVDQWFAENTYISREFAELERLVTLKKEQEFTISLGLPALNEADTVGNVIETIKSALMDDYPLLDEIVLIDSGSVDYTREIAQELGIPVYIHQQILPEYGSLRGKGEALWKSLYILQGDIIAWIDTDIKNIHPRFVYGIIGPLLLDTRIDYVKGFYRRPLKQDDKVIAGGGGRVTELTARPLINLFFPELSGIIQPLSGEYAGRKSALEKLNFFSGYGVEIGMLIDIMRESGLGSIAQVDLLERVHHNQPLPSLSKMSFAIIQVILGRLEKIEKINLLKGDNLTMNLIRYELGNYYLEAEEIHDIERPPMVELVEYRQKWGLASPNEG